MATLTLNQVMLLAALISTVLYVYRAEVLQLFSPEADQSGGISVSMALDAMFITCVFHLVFTAWCFFQGCMRALGIQR